MNSNDMRLVLVLAAAAFGAGCSFEQDSNGNRVSKAGEGRQETQSIRNMENIGRSENAIADKLDQAINISERRDDELDKELEQYH